MSERALFEAFEAFSSLLEQRIEKQGYISENWLRYALYATLQEKLKLSPNEISLDLPFNRVPCKFPLFGCSVGCYVNRSTFKSDEQRLFKSIKSEEQRSSQSEAQNPFKGEEQMLSQAEVQRSSHCEEQTSSQGKDLESFAFELKFLHQIEDERLYHKRDLNNYELKQIGSLFDTINKLSFFTVPGMRRFMVYIVDSFFDTYMADSNAANAGSVFNSIYSLKPGDKAIFLNYTLLEQQGRNFKGYATKTLNDWNACDIRNVFERDFAGKDSRDSKDSRNSRDSSFYHLKVLEILAHKFRNS